MRHFKGFFVLFALTLILPRTSAEAQAPPSDPWSPVVEWMENLMESAVSGESSEQKVRDYYHQNLSSKSQSQVTEGQFINYWRHTATRAQGGQPAQLSYSIGNVTYNDAHNQAHITYRYRFFPTESSHTGTSDVVLENGVWKMVLSPEIIAEMQKEPAVQSKPSPTTSPSGTQTRPSPATKSPSVPETQSNPPPTTSAPSVAAVSVVPARPPSVFEGTVSQITSSGSTTTFYGVHLRWDPRAYPSIFGSGSKLGLELSYSMASLPGGGTGNAYTALVTSRWEGLQGIFRFGGGVDGTFVNGVWPPSYQYSPVVGIEEDWFVNPRMSVEAGAAFDFAVTGYSGGSSVSGTAWAWSVGLRYTSREAGGFTITGGYKFSNANLTIAGTPASTSASGPYLRAGIAF